MKAGVEEERAVLGEEDEVPLTRSTTLSLHYPSGKTKGRTWKKRGKRERERKRSEGGRESSRERY